MQRSKHDQAGFTIIELLIATTVFSFFLLLTSSMILQISRTYYKSTLEAKTQESAREIISEISQAIQVSDGTVTPISPAFSGGTTSSFCAGSARFTFRPGIEQFENGTAPDQANHVLVADSVPAGCPTGSLTAFSSNTQRELMPDRTRLADLTVTPLGALGLYTIKVRLVYGDAEVLSNPGLTNAGCAAIRTSQFCAISELTTTVQKRL